MQDLEAVASQLGKIATAFKDGGLYFLIGVIAFLAYLLISAAMKRRRQATQEVNVTLPPAPPANGNGHTPELIRAHSERLAKAEGGIDNLAGSLETMRKENREDHKQIFDAIGALKQA